MWVWVWSLLVVAALAVLGWVAWGVVRAGLRLLREAGAAGRTVGEVSERLDQALRRAEEQRADTSATMFDPPEVLRGRVAERRRQRLRRRALRRQRQAATWRSWTTSTWWERRRHERYSTR
ncbi:hypothetical protein GCM10009718_23670 [Isoptericola halotolerans]|uniref:Flagellar biosynthesis/type III secretory pathway M-ring protein FliF/YscJ n=1 Tax=Isoptericola halotolerans TaxID=300560 RepID=A0ABX2A5T5_9MICO|nr:hypothetical protein [Isoptericola halotolerans]NOV98070.1 flagellar biosynthesis/type III secretory pathway M-ring protein FliF/YscJ [Isoptericola halotolerans]